MNSLQKQQLRASLERHFPQKSMQDNNSEINIDELKRAISFMSKQAGHEKTSTKLLLHSLNSSHHHGQQNNHNDDHHTIITSQQLQHNISKLISSQTAINDATTVSLLFQLLDADKDGLINIQDFRVYLDSIGSTMQLSQTQEFFQLMTPEGNYLTKQQFAVILRHL